jgi:hypothetical protein
MHKAEPPLAGSAIGSAIGSAPVGSAIAAAHQQPEQHLPALLHDHPCLVMLSMNSCYSSEAGGSPLAYLYPSCVRQKSKALCHCHGRARGGGGGAPSQCHPRAGTTHNATFAVSQPATRPRAPNRIPIYMEKRRKNRDKGNKDKDSRTARDKRKGATSK